MGQKRTLESHAGYRTLARHSLEHFPNDLWFLPGLRTAIHPGFFLPAMIARWGATIDRLTGGRWSIAKMVDAIDPEIIARRVANTLGARGMWASEDKLLDLREACRA